MMLLALLRRALTRRSPPRMSPSWERLCFGTGQIVRPEPRIIGWRYVPRMMSMNRKASRP